MNCPSCGAPMRLTSGNASLRCDYCKNVVVAKADDTGVQFLDEAQKLTCPTCAAALWGAILAEIQISACKQCHGLLVSMADFEPLLEHMRALHAEREIPGPADSAELESKLICPNCHQRMDTHYYFGGGHAVMSTCERCEQHWLDAGVLMRIVRTPQLSEE